MELFSTEKSKPKLTVGNITRFWAYDNHYCINVSYQDKNWVCLGDLDKSLFIAEENWDLNKLELKQIAGSLLGGKVLAEEFNTISKKHSLSINNGNKLITVEGISGIVSLANYRNQQEWINWIQRIWNL